MALIALETFIAAPIGVCFDASRDVGLHLASAAGTGERVVRGRTSGLCEVGDEITWEARHFGIRQKLSVEIAEVEYPRYFVDRMTRGAFKSMRHEHYFDAVAEGTRMRDKFMYEVPLGVAGRLFDWLVLERHMRHFLLERNRHLKQVCEARNIA